MNIDDARVTRPFVLPASIIKQKLVLALSATKATTKKGCATKIEKQLHRVKVDAVENGDNGCGGN